MSAVPKLRFPDFCGEWKHSKIGNFLSWHKQKTKAENEFSVMSSSRAGLVLQSEYYGENRITLRSNIGFNVIPPNYVTFRNRSDDRKFFFNINRTGATGAISQFYPVFDVVNADKEFLVMLLNVKQHELGILSVGTSQTVLSNSELTNAKFAFPSLPEQHKIASFLSCVDKKIDLLLQKKDVLELCKKGLMQKIFSKEIRFKQDDGSDYPDWEEVALSEIAKRSTEKNKDLELTLVLTNSAIQGVVSQTEYFDKSIANEANISGYYKIRKYDFVYNPRISSSAPVGPISQNLKEDGVMSPLYTIFRVEVQYQGFSSVYFKSSVWYDYMRSVANQGARHDRMNITTSDFMALPIDLPCAEERKKIADFLSATDKKIQNISSQIEQMETLKKGLLQQMFV